ncbi:hypothetical protein S40288_01004 [Stachybotrys chartarum IBT 40288]|nr:hypothetical protein S40288_01004 [Stachybotrys chartarum IBT 40288]
MAMRRPHSKSRRGCVNCKRRKVKCDEKAPVCFNCDRHGVPCSLSSTDSVPGTPHDAKSPRQPHLAPLAPRPPPETTFPSPADSSPANADREHVTAPFPAEVMGQRALELMHHYCTVTADTLAIRQDMCHVYRISFPRVGYRHPFLMHGLLSLAAGHKAYLSPASRSTYLALGDYYQTIGSAAFRAAMQGMQKDIYPALWGFSGALILYLYSLPARLGNSHLEDPVACFLDVVGLMRGLKTTLNPIISVVLRSEFSPLIHGTYPGEQSASIAREPCLEDTLLPPDTWQVMVQLRRFLESDLPSASREPYSKALDHMEECLRWCAVSGMHVEVGIALAWMYLIEDSIIVDIQARQAHAMLLLAYYSILLAVLERSFWLARGWAKQLMNQIAASLRGQVKFFGLLEWPRHHVDSLCI